ncbi:MAG: sialate O-acetylesterase [Bacteroidota bacterium]
MRIKPLLFCLLALAGVLFVNARIVLPSIISSNMVLQQNARVALWGKAKRGSKISIITGWNRKSYSTTTLQDSSWKLMVETPAAGGPYEISISDGEAVTLKNILIGEVWLCSGQSNMEMPVKGFGNQPILHSNDILVDAENPQIRLFRVEKAMTRTPQPDCKATPWEDANAQSVKEFSAVGYQFAKILQEKLKVPVGVIMSAYGGTKIEAWMDAQSLKTFPGTKIIPVSDTAAIIKNDATVLYNAMIHPIEGYGINGAIWYQGESNRSNAKEYDRLMQEMVASWRKLWQMGDWPFYYVQIAPYVYTERDVRGLAPALREAQEKALSLIPNSGMVVTMDIGMEKTIHPPDKSTVSRRLAYLALANRYGKKGISFASPSYKSMRVTDTAVYVNFQNTPNGLMTTATALSAFEIAGEDRIFYPAKAKISGNGVMIENGAVKKPVAVRYGFKDFITGDLFNTEGLPVAPFRTDQW